MKYLNIEEKMKQMIHKREEALAAHKLARIRMSNWKQSRFIPFEKGQKVWLDTRNIKINYHKKIMPKHEGPFEIDEVHIRTHYLLTKTSRIMENPQCLPHHTFMTLHWKQDLQKQLSKTISRITRRRRNLWSGNYFKTQKTRKRLSILYQIKRISCHQSNMGKWISIFRWWRYVETI